MEREIKESHKKHDHVKQLMGREYDLILRLGTLASSLKLQYWYNGSPDTLRCLLCSNNIEAQAWGLLLSVGGLSGTSWSSGRLSVRTEDEWFD